MGIKIGVTKPEFDKAQSRFAEGKQKGFDCVQLPSEELELAAALREQGMRHAVIGVVRYQGPLYDALPRGGVIARFGVGHDGVDKIRATALGLFCTNTPGVLDDSVAEHTINLLLSLARRTVDQVIAVKAGQWSPRLGVELRGKLLAVIGCGAIGCRVARIASHGLGMRVVGLKRNVGSEHQLQQEFGFERIVPSFDMAVREADFVSLHLPGAAETHHFLNRERMRLLKPGCFLINTARGMLVDEIALHEVVVNGRLAGVALDVCEVEPYAPASPELDLRNLPNILITPHIASSTQEACDRMAERALRNIELASQGRFTEMDLVNREILR